MTRTVGIYIFDEIEVLDLGGPFEVFSTATRMKARHFAGSEKPFEVFTVAETPRPVRARGGLIVQPAHDFTIRWTTTGGTTRHFPDGAGESSAPGRAGPRNDRSTMSSRSVETTCASRQSQRMISGKIAPPIFWP